VVELAVVVEVVVEEVVVAVVVGVVVGVVAEGPPLPPLPLHLPPDLEAQVLLGMHPQIPLSLGTSILGMETQTLFSFHFKAQAPLPLDLEAQVPLPLGSPPSALPIFHKQCQQSL